MNCASCGESMTGRKRKYCQPECRPTFYQKKNAGLEFCQVCNKPLASIGAGRPKRNCSRLCRERARARPKKQQVQKNCEWCSKTFSTAKHDQRFCSKKCRLEVQKVETKERARNATQALYPDGKRTAPCGWCGEPRTFDIRKSVVNAYHPKCTKEARSARYRIKTVKRQKVSKPHRISHERVIEEYGSNCFICGAAIDLDLPRTHRYGLTVDHLMPISKGGTDELGNLRPAHWICNIKKSDKLPEELDA